jgi:ATP-dependent DNA helicase RecG
VIPTSAELEALLSDLESDLAERKASAADRSAIRRTICAFANDLPGHRRAGVIFVGANNDGSCANLPVTDQLMTTLAQMRSDGNILPPPTMYVEKMTLNGCNLAVMIVEPSYNPPVRYQGRTWVKVASVLQQATMEDERRLSERRRAGDLPFDLRPVFEASNAELDMEFFRSEYLRSALAPEVLEENQRGIDDQLKALRFMTNGVPNYGALLVFGKDPLRWVPGAYLQFVRFDGGQLDDPVRDQKRLSGRLSQILSAADDLLQLHIEVAADSASGPREVRRPDYPIIALREFIRNALIHRAYDGTNAPVKVFWFTDRIEISNPGGLYGQVNQGNFGKGATDYRNPLLAEAMAVLGFVQRFGMGIPRAVRELKENGNPRADFEFSPSSVLVTLRPAS